MNKKIILTAIIPCLIINNVTVMAKGPVYNVEARESEKGEEQVLEIKASYTIDGVKYKTNLSDFHIGIGDMAVETVIFHEGITEVKNSVFAFTDVQNVFFPKSMEIVYDETLGYLHPQEDNEYVRIYYGGTQEEWAEIFTKYKSRRVRDAIEDRDLEEVGRPLEIS